MNRGPLESVRVSVGQAKSRNTRHVIYQQCRVWGCGIYFRNPHGTYMIKRRALSDEVKYVFRDAKITQAAVWRAIAPRRSMKATGVASRDAH